MKENTLLPLVAVRALLPLLDGATCFFVAGRTGLGIGGGPAVPVYHSRGVSGGGQEALVQNPPSPRHVGRERPLMSYRAHETLASGIGPQQKVKQAAYGQPCAATVYQPHGPYFQNPNIMQVLKATSLQSRGANGGSLIAVFRT